MGRITVVIVLAFVLSACGGNTGPSPGGASIQRGGFDTQILLLREDPDRIKAYLRAIPPENVREAMVYLAQRDRDSIPNDESPHTVVFVLYENLAPGTRIRTSHQFERPGLGKLGPYRFSYRLPKLSLSDKPTVLINTSQAGGSGGWLTYRLFVGYALASEKTVTIW